MRRPFQAVLTAAMLLASSSASAQNFGEKGQLAISAERLFGLTHDSSTRTVNGLDTSRRVTTVSLLSSPVVPGGVDPAWGGYAAPRVAGDYFVINHLSLGVALGYSHWSRNSDVAGGTVTVSGDGFTFAPRIGYQVAFSDKIGIWPRAGFTYQTFSDDTRSVHDVAFTLEAPFTFSLIPHVVFWGGPTLDLGLSGSASNQIGNGQRISNDFNATDLGLQTGLVVYFEP